VPHRVVIHILCALFA